MARRVQGEGSVYPRKDGRFAAAVQFEGKRITKYGKTKKEAWDNLQAYLSDLKAGKIVIGPKQTVGQYLTHWLENEHRLQIDLISLQQYRSHLKVHLIPAFGHLQLDQLAREHVQAFCSEKLDSGLAPASIRAIHAVLSVALGSAVKNGILARNVCTLVVLPRLVKKKPNVLNKEQCTRLVAAARGRRLWFMILVAITTGARLGELLSLRWEDVDINNLRIHIHRTVSRIKGIGFVEKSEPKTAAGSRQVALTQVVVDAIQEQKEYIENIRLKAGLKWKSLDLVFPNQRGNYLDAGSVRKELNIILGEASLDARTFHKLRHSAATLLFAAGVNAKIVSEALGHSAVAFTLQVYGDVLPDMQQEVANVMDTIFE